MNRATKRKAMKTAKGQAKQKFTLLELQKAFSIAQEMEKESRGHLFSHHMKERCVFCGKGRRTKIHCDYWFLTFMDRVQTILINPTFFVGADTEALWLQHAAEYAAIQVPVVKND